ncbi:MAG: restriction endonuclease subunit S [Paenibacillaceae bacterium]
MNRNEAYVSIVEAMTSIQGHIAFILEAQAVEAEKSRSWLCEYVRDGACSDHKLQLKQATKVHGQLIEVIDGIVKMENGIAHNLKILLNKNEDSSSDDSSSLFGSLMNSGDDDT